MSTIAIDPDRLVGRDWLDREIDGFVDYCKACPPSHPSEPVMVAGDRERKSVAKRQAEGIPVDDNTRAELMDAARSLDISDADLEAHVG